MDAKTNHFRHTLDEALSLQEDQRELLAVLLTESLENVDEASIEAAWTEECLRRMRDIDAGIQRAIPWAEAREQLLAL